jgi:hypothetical protein
VFEKAGTIEKPARLFRPRADFSDDGHVPVICPTGQVEKNRRRRRVKSEASFENLAGSKRPAGFSGRRLIFPTMDIFR